MKYLPLTVTSLILLLITGCGSSPSRTTDTRSTAFTTLPEKQAFLEQYVTFRRTYQSLDFQVQFTDGGTGAIPSPSEWDIRILAEVPAEELDSWTDGLSSEETIPTEWVNAIPNSPENLEGFRWFKGSGKTVGLHPESGTVLYRSQAQ